MATCGALGAGDKSKLKSDILRVISWISTKKCFQNASFVVALCVGLFALFTLFYSFQKLTGTCRWEVLYVASIAGFINLVAVLFSDYEPMT